MAGPRCGQGLGEMKDFYVSYHESDRSWAEWVAWLLEAEGHTVELPAWDLRTGQNRVLEMERAAQQAQRIVLILSDDYLAGSKERAEIAAIVDKDPAGEKGLIVPVRV